MKPRMKIKLAVDALMTIALLFLMGYQFFGEQTHEWIGIGSFVLFIIHHLLNAHWHKTLLTGKYTAMRVIQTCVDALVLLAMLALMYSSIIMSRYVFQFLQISGGMALARKLHILGAYWGFVLMSVHLGLHWNMVLAVIRKQFAAFKISKLRSIVCFGVGLAIAAYGVYVFFSRDLLTYLLLETEFVFFDFNESVLLFYLDYLALMGLFIFIPHYLTKLFRVKTKRNAKG